MDAYDIFKKLSRGAKFSRPINGSSHQTAGDRDSVQQQNQAQPEIDVKGVKRKSHLDDTSESEGLVILRSFGKEEATAKKSKKRKMMDGCEFEKKQKLLKVEEINRYRNLNNIAVVGRNVPDPTRSFDEFPIKEDLIENLRKCGYVEPTPIQKQALPVLLQGRQLLACAPTGSGKTAAFLIPVIEELKQPERQGFRALILCPTRELAKQTQRECIKLSEGRGLRIHVMSKIKLGLSNYGPNSSQKFDILITTPNRLCYLLNQDPPAISLSNIKWLVIDEADRLFEVGNRGFREQLDQILKTCSNSDRKIAMFSATYTPVVAKWCVHNMKGLVRVTVGQRNAATESVEQELLYVGNEQGKLLAFRDIVRKGLDPPVLVFVQSKDRAQQLFSELIYDGINVDAIHADRTQLQRDNTVKSFREGKIWVLICTELMARGIDFKGVNLVINYDFPPSSISYVHRVGRAGRAGQQGKAITFITAEDKLNLRSIAHIIRESGSKVPDYMLTMKKTSRKERKQLEKAAPHRDNISTKLKHPRLQRKRQHHQGTKDKKVTKSLVAPVVNKKTKKIRLGNSVEGIKNNKRRLNGAKKDKNLKKSGKKR